MKPPQNHFAKTQQVIFNLLHVIFSCFQCHIVKIHFDTGVTYRDICERRLIETSEQLPVTSVLQSLCTEDFSNLPLLDGLQVRIHHMVFLSPLRSEHLIRSSETFIPALTQPIVYFILWLVLQQFTKKLCDIKCDSHMIEFQLVQANRQNWHMLVTFN